MPFLLYRLRQGTHDSGGSHVDRAAAPPRGPLPPQQWLGAGNSADTYLAHDRLLDRQVAIKLLRAHHAGDAAEVERFRREARTAAAIRHPNVVAVFNHGQDDGRLFTVLELISCGSMREHLRERATLPAPEAVAVMQGVLDGLAAIHQRGIVHGDVKLENILLTSQGMPKLTDFGIARSGTDAAESGEVACGTAAYMAPEQAKGQPLSPASDLYAVGAVLYELLTGHPPFPVLTPSRCCCGTSTSSPWRRIPAVPPCLWG